MRGRIAPAGGDERVQVGHAVHIYIRSPWVHYGQNITLDSHVSLMVSLFHVRIGIVLAKWRWAERLTLRVAAARMGVSFPTLARIEKGERMDGATLARVLTWLLAEAK